MKQKQYRQGDLLFVWISKLPSGPYHKRENGHILEGEATGHVHRLADLDKADVAEIEAGLFLSVSDAGVSIIHEEHAPVGLPAGLYEVRRQREYSPEEIRNVAD